jgi:Thiol-activated cytolysin
VTKILNDQKMSRWFRFELVFVLLILAACSGNLGNNPNQPNEPSKLTLSVKSPVSVKQGAIASTTLTLGRTNLEDKITLKIASAPSGITATFSENPATGTSLSVNIDVAETVAMGNYTLALSGVSGDLNASANLVIEVLDKNAAGQRADYNAYSATLPEWPQYSPEKPDEDKATGAKTPLPNDVVDGVGYSCTTTPYSLSRTPEQIVTYDPDSSILWVGSLLQGKGYKDGIGSLKELPIRQRSPLTLSIDLLNNNNTVTVQDPTVASVQQAIGKLIEEATKSGLKSGSKISFSQLTTNELSEASLKLGLSYKWLSGGIKSNLSFQRKSNEKTITAHFIQNMFTISMVLPQTPEDVFSEGFTKDVLDRQVQLGNLGSDNIPTYVANIVYGRILTFTFTSTANETDIRAALDAAYNLGKVGLSAGQQKILSEAKVGVATIGGDASDALAVIRSGELKDYFKSDAPLTTAKPISYTVRNLGDNSIAKVSETSEYNIKECTAIAGGSNVEIPEGKTVSFIPPHTRGDRDFAGHGPSVTASTILSLGSNGKTLVLTVNMKAIETKSDFTTAEGTKDFEIYRTEPGFKINKILTDTESFHDYIDTNHEKDIFNLGEADLVKTFSFMGDDEGNEAGDKTHVMVLLNKILLEVVPE